MYGYWYYKKSYSERKPSGIYKIRRQERLRLEGLVFHERLKWKLKRCYWNHMLFFSAVIQWHGYMLFIEELMKSFPKHYMKKMWSHLFLFHINDFLAQKTDVSCIFHECSFRKQCSQWKLMWKIRQNYFSPAWKVLSSLGEAIHLVYFQTSIFETSASGEVNGVFEGSVPLCWLSKKSSWLDHG